MVAKAAVGVGVGRRQEGGGGVLWLLDLVVCCSDLELPSLSLWASSMSVFRADVVLPGGGFN